MRYILLISIMILSLGVKSQVVDYSKKIPNKYGVTHHFIEEDKINLMKDANLASDIAKSCERGLMTGYIEVGVAAAGMTVAGLFMKVPQHWSDGRHEGRADNRKNWRTGVVIVSSIIGIDGVLRIGRNHKKLKKIQYTLTPTSGGVRFYF